METSTTSTNTPVPVRAAHYVRMSTEHQQYSPENQSPSIRCLAQMEIVQEYLDHGRSGLNIAGREGLNQLMSDAESKRTDFSAQLVYDVSRWGSDGASIEFRGFSQLSFGALASGKRRCCCCGSKH